MVLLVVTVPTVLLVCQFIAHGESQAQLEGKLINYLLKVK